MPISKHSQNNPYDDTEATSKAESLRLNTLATQMSKYPTYDPVLYCLLNGLWKTVKGRMPPGLAQKQNMAKILHNHKQSIENS